MEMDYLPWDVVFRCPCGGEFKLGKDPDRKFKIIGRSDRTAKSVLCLEDVPNLQPGTSTCQAPKPYNSPCTGVASILSGIVTGVQVGGETPLVWPIIGLTKGVPPKVCHIAPAGPEDRPAHTILGGLASRQILAQEAASASPPLDTGPTLTVKLARDDDTVQLPHIATLIRVRFEDGTLQLFGLDGGTCTFRCGSNKMCWISFPLVTDDSWRCEEEGTSRCKARVVVEKDDTLLKIAGRHETTAEKIFQHWPNRELFASTGRTTPHVIYPGEQFYLPGRHCDEQQVSIDRKQVEVTFSCRFSNTVPLVDVHCHIFGHSVFQMNGSVVPVLQRKNVRESVAPILKYLAPGASVALGRLLSRVQQDPVLDFLSAIVSPDYRNASAVLAGLPVVPGINASGNTCRALFGAHDEGVAVPLLMDFGFHPLQVPGILHEISDLADRGDVVQSSAFHFASESAHHEASSSDIPLPTKGGGIAMAVRVEEIRASALAAGADRSLVRLELCQTQRNSHDSQVIRIYPGADTPIAEGGWYTFFGGEETWGIHSVVPIFAASSTQTYEFRLTELQESGNRRLANPVDSTTPDFTLDAVAGTASHIVIPFAGEQRRYEVAVTLIPPKMLAEHHDTDHLAIDIEFIDIVRCPTNSAAEMAVSLWEENAPISNIRASIPETGERIAINQCCALRSSQSRSEIAMSIEFSKTSRIQELLAVLGAFRSRSPWALLFASTTTGTGADTRYLPVTVGRYTEVVRTHAYEIAITYAGVWKTTPVSHPSQAMWYSPIASKTPQAASSSNQHRATARNSSAAYLWINGSDRRGFEGTMRSAALAAARTAGRVLPFAPFDPRRPYALESVQQAIEDLGFVGVKLYCRTGWMPSGNDQLYPAHGALLDRRTLDLFRWAAKNGIPVLNHTAPGGWPLPRAAEQRNGPPSGMLVFPPKYQRLLDSRKRSQSEQHTTPSEGIVAFPPIWANRIPQTNSPLYGPYDKDVCELVATDIIEKACYCHYVQVTTSPHAWKKTLEEVPSLRLCFAHSGGAVSVAFRYSADMDLFLSQAPDSERDDFERQRMVTPMCGDGSGFRGRFIQWVASDKFGRPDFCRPVEDFFGENPEWEEWFTSWETCYSSDWLTQILRFEKEKEYEGVYSDMSYLGDDNRHVFLGILLNLISDARMDTVEDGLGPTLSEKLMIGTDWSMIALEGMGPADFWQVFLDAMHIDRTWGPLSAPDQDLFRRWGSLNAWSYLNLDRQNRTSGDAFDSLRRFYRIYSPQDQVSSGERRIQRVRQLYESVIRARKSCNR